ncbi:hypothetical protein LZG75_01495 [Polynucleobacter sp. IMCC30063]|uniref:hypothetical protein n=1 Tax=unclassified Polynucleobacter TaxID=2640945 RepID=UPI001F440842|nr:MULTISPECIES: hypothetical protein [unclassified Polynucleobacter]MCE7504910.1 hypothetical protein [Polynucleobacter sp. IMCC30063]MCE7528605.1 hypothetical protein [Polynucleobacter sp. IMCC 29146]
MSNGHGSLIKTPKQLIVVVSLSFFVPLLIILLLMVYVNSGQRESGGSIEAEKGIAQRIKPVGQVTLSAAAVPPSVAENTAPVPPAVAAITAPAAKAAAK